MTTWCYFMVTVMIKFTRQYRTCEKGSYTEKLPDRKQSRAVWEWRRELVQSVSEGSVTASPTITLPALGLVQLITILHFFITKLYSNTIFSQVDEKTLDLSGS